MFDIKNESEFADASNSMTQPWQRMPFKHDWQKKEAIIVPEKGNSEIYAKFEPRESHDPLKVRTR